MTSHVLDSLSSAMAAHGFRVVPEPARTIPHASLLLKRQTLNMNRAIVAIELPEVPADLAAYLRTLRRQVAFRCRFFPFLWGVGIQVILFADGFSSKGIQPEKHVAIADNQWAIIQSLFLVDTASKDYLEGRTWGQVFSGKFQDAISAVLAKTFHAKGVSSGPSPIT